MTSKQYAKEHSLDIPHISCIEFPLKVNNVDRALQMVGGKEAIIRACQDEMTNPLELRFTKNIYEHPVNAKLSSNEQILIKVTVPKKALEANEGSVQKTLKQMHEEKKAVHITPVAIINKTFRFREMADFQYSPQTSEFTQTINKSIHSMNYENIKKLEKVFAPDKKPWEPAESGQFELPPPPRFSSIPLPFNYQYKKNAATVIKEGKLSIKSKRIKLHSIIIRWEDEVPQEPTPELKQQLENFQNEPDNMFSRDILHTIEILKGLFDKKPVWIRKHLEAVLSPHLQQCLKYALPQVSYTYTKGPWRQSYIRLGLDPKSSRSLAPYQTERFRIPNVSRTFPKNTTNETLTELPDAFKFNGEELPVSLSFQLENLVDPDVKKILFMGTFREECDFHDGWYDALTMTKLRRLMRYKIRSLVDGTRIEMAKVDHIINKLELAEGKDGDKDDKDIKEDIEDDDDDDDDDEEAGDGYELDVSDANYNEILKYLEKFNPRGAGEIEGLAGLLKQRDLDI